MAEIWHRAALYQRCDKWQIKFKISFSRSFVAPTNVILYFDEIHNLCHMIMLHACFADPPPALPD